MSIIKKNVMRKNGIYTVLIASVLFLFFSCATNNPFTDQDPYVSALGDVGSYIFTTTDQDLISRFIDIKQIRFTRVSGVYDPVTQRYYGALEGKFSKFVAETGISLSKEFKKEKIGKLTVWTYEKNNIQLTIPSNGVILFASDDLVSVYEKTFKFRERKISEIIISMLVNASSAMYVQSPSVMPDFGLDLSESVMERFDYILATVNEENKYSVNFTLITREYSDSFFKLIKMAYTTEERRKGVKNDINHLKTILTQEDLSVFLKDQDFTDELFLNMIDINLQ